MDNRFLKMVRTLVFNNIMDTRFRLYRHNMTRQGLYKWGTKRSYYTSSNPIQFI